MTKVICVQLSMKVVPLLFKKTSKKEKLCIEGLLLELPIGLNQLYDIRCVCHGSIFYGLKILKSFIGFYGLSLS